MINLTAGSRPFTVDHKTTGKAHGIHKAKYLLMQRKNGHLSRIFK